MFACKIGDMESVEVDLYNHWSMLEYPEIRFTWVISNFSEWIATIKRQKEWVAYSPLFPREPCPTKWKLMFRIEKERDGEEKISLLLCPLMGPSNLEVFFHFMFYDNLYVPRMAEVDLSFTPTDKFLGYEGFYDLPKLLADNEPRGNTVKFACIVTINEKLRSTDSCEKVQKLHVANAKLNADMEKLLTTDKFGDVELVVGNRTFTAYKGILAARSTVFADLFQGQGNRFEIDKMEPEVFQELLRYIYTDQVSDLAGMKFKLMGAAHRYNINSLKYLCKQAFLSEKLSLDTFADALIAGSIYEVPAVKIHAVCYIEEGPVGFTQTRGWKELSEAHPSLANEVVEVMLMLASDLNKLYNFN